jgi:hypothetical protein
MAGVASRDRLHFNQTTPSSGAGNLQLSEKAIRKSPSGVLPVYVVIPIDPEILPARVVIFNVIGDLFGNCCQVQ